MFYQFFYVLIFLGIFQSQEIEAIDSIKNLFSEQKPQNPPSQENSYLKPVDFLTKSHKAYYTISLKENKSEDILEANGIMSVQIIDTIDGWSTEEQSFLIVYYNDETSEQINTTLITWEAKSGLKYRFYARTLRNGLTEIVMQGEATKPTPYGAGIVEYQLPEGHTIALPVNTIFPIQYKLEILKMAFSGVSLNSSTVFDGSNQLLAADEINTFIGHPQPSNLVVDQSHLFNTKVVYLLRMAVYSENSEGLEADYEIIENLLDCGIFRDRTIDYGDFKVQAVLQKIDVFSSSNPITTKESINKDSK